LGGEGGDGLALEGVEGLFSVVAPDDDGDGVVSGLTGGGGGATECGVGIGMTSTGS
jgi:hypothetical protein